MGVYPLVPMPGGGREGKEGGEGKLGEGRGRGIGGGSIHLHKRRAKGDRGRDGEEGRGGRGKRAQGGGSRRSFLVYRGGGQGSTHVLFPAEFLFARNSLLRKKQQIKPSPGGEGRSGECWGGFWYSSHS